MPIRPSESGYLALAIQDRTTSDGLNQTVALESGTFMTTTNSGAGTVLAVPFRPGLKATPNASSTKYREGGGGRDATLLIREKVGVDLTIPVFAKPLITGMLFRAALGVEGITQAPLVKAAGANTTVTAASAKGATALAVASNTNIANGDTIIIGKGPTQEAIVVTTTGASLTVPALKFPHVIGESVIETAWVGTIAVAPAIGDVTLSIAAIGPGVPVTATGSLQIGDGSNYGRVEIVDYTTIGAISAGRYPISGIAVHAGLATTAQATGIQRTHLVGELVFPIDTTTAFIHTFAPLNDISKDLDYLTAEISRANLTINRFKNLKLGKMTLKMGATKPIDIQADFMGTDGTARDKASPLSAVAGFAYESAKITPFCYFHGNFNISAGISPNYSNISTFINQMDVNFENVLAAELYDTNITRDDVIALARNITFSAKVYFDSASTFQLYNQVYFGIDGNSPTTAANISAVIPNGSVSMRYAFKEPTDATFKEMHFWFPNVVWEKAEVDLDPEPKPLEMTVSGSPLYDPGGTSGYQDIMTVMVENTRANHYALDGAGKPIHVSV